MTFYTRYSPEPVNGRMDPMEVINSPAFGPAVMRAIQDPRIAGYLVPRSIPQRAVRTDFVTELPLAANDGDEVYFQCDATRGIVWHLRYRANSQSPFLWEFVGGGPLVADTVADQGTTSTSYTDLATVGPTVSIPLAGDYTIAFGAHSYSDGANTNFVSPYLGTTAVDANASQIDHTTANKLFAHARTLPSTTLNASDTVKLQYRVLSGTGQFRNRWLTAAPIRVGRT